MIRPEKPTGFCALISSCGSELIKAQADASITRVQVPDNGTMFVTVSGMVAGGGLKSAMSKVKPLRVSIKLVSSRLTMAALIVEPVRFTGKPVPVFVKLRFQKVF